MSARTIIFPPSGSLAQCLANANLALPKMNNSVARASKHPSLLALQASAGEAAALLKALGNERRLMLLCLLVEHGELSAGELASQVGLSASASSQHLAKMKEEGLVAPRREAQTIYYRIADPRVRRVIALLKSLYCP